MATVVPDRARARPRLRVEGHERLAALLGAITIAFSSILVRLSHASPSTAAIFRCAYALPVLLLLAWREDRRHGRRTWAERRAGLAAGLTNGRGGAARARPVTCAMRIAVNSSAQLRSTCASTSVNPPWPP